MWYFKINFWFTTRVFFYNCCFTFLSLATGDVYATILILLSAGFIIGVLAQKALHQKEEYAFQNLGISNKERYLFAYIFHLVFGFAAFFIAYLILNHV